MVRCSMDDKDRNSHLNILPILLIRPKYPVFDCKIPMKPKAIIREINIYMEDMVVAMPQDSTN
jgi:hypothetical protein